MMIALQIGDMCVCVNRGVGVDCTLCQHDEKGMEEEESVATCGAPALGWRCTRCVR